MSLLTPDEQFDELKKSVHTALGANFPMETPDGKSRLVLHGVEVVDRHDTEDFRSQEDAIKRQKTWSVPVYANVALEREGKEVSRDKVLLMHLPRITPRYSYIIDGNEYQALNQFRLKPGVYHRIRGSGEIRAEFNLGNKERLAGGRAFSIDLDPAEGVFYVNHRDSRIPLYHLAKSAGISDDELEGAWGKEVLQRNKEKSGSQASVYSRFYKAVHGKSPQKPEEHAELFGKLLDKTELLPEVTEQTLGVKKSKVDKEVLLGSTQKLLGISRGDVESDDKSGLNFQSIHSFEDLLAGQLVKSMPTIKRRIQFRMGRKGTEPKEALSAEDFDRPVRSFFRTSLVSQPEQTNPLETLAGRMKTTIMGEHGGIQSVQAVLTESKLIHPSHLGFLDPIHTPEGERTGISLALPLGARKEGNTLKSLFVDTKTHKPVTLEPGEALKSVVAFPDQYSSKGGKFLPLTDKVKATQDGHVIWVSPKEVDYVLPSPRSVFGVASNLIPFLSNNQGNRAMTAARQQEQAVPLEHREVPLVQSVTDRGDTFEELIGKNYAARVSPVEGEVVEVKKDAVVIKGAKGKKHEVQIYRNFPLKGATLMDSEVKVKKGDKVQEGQLLADSTFTKDGTLALGTNLHTGYMPWHGYNFEDGIVISDDAAKKLTSLHMYENRMSQDPDTIVDRKRFQTHLPQKYNRRQLEKLDKDGVVQVGQVVEEGDPLVLALKKADESVTYQKLQKLRRGDAMKLRDISMTWDKPYPGEVTDVVQHGKDIVAYVKTKEPAQVGDKIVARHGNKGVITRIIPTEEMPYTHKDGEKRHLDILLNPLGVPGRINLGQVLETAAGKLAEKKGDIYKVKNFEPGKDYLSSLKGELAKAGIQDKEHVINPETGKPFEQTVLVGNQYFFKLKHQVGKKMAARSGSGGVGARYDVDRAPAGGAPHGGQSMGELGTYALLAHGARENLHEMQAYKTTKNDDVWNAIRSGTLNMLPPPKVPFAYDKFEKYLNALRLNLQKEGTKIALVPFTEAQVRKMSAGELTDPGVDIIGKNDKPEQGGLFDPRITGGKDGTRWSHFSLVEPMPNPLFEEAIKKVLGMSSHDYRAIIRGEKEVDGLRGGLALEAMLKKVDVKKEIGTTTTKLNEIGKAIQRKKDSPDPLGKTSGVSALPKLHDKLRILRALDTQGHTPTVYMMRSVPIIPPVFRPLTLKPDGSVSSTDINGLYKDLAASNDALRLSIEHGIPDAKIADQRAEIYDGLKALTGTGGALTREYRGVLDILAGKSRVSGGDTKDTGGAKTGFFQQKLLKRRHDFSGRSTIIPEPKMGIDELGLPEEMAWVMYQPFIERELIRQGYRKTPAPGAPPNRLDAVQAYKERSPVARNALERVIKERPIFLKRDPALHKFNVMAFKPRLISGKAIEIHPLVTSGYNADFDGDAMSVYLPLQDKAVREAQKLFPSNNLFSPTTGAVMYTPGHEALLGLYLMTQPGKKTDKKYRTQEDALTAEQRGDISATDIIRVGGHETTAGKLRVERILPSSFHELGKRKVTDMRVLGKKATESLLTQIAHHEPTLYGEVANKLKDLGNEYSTHVGYSIGLDDFKVINKEARDRLIREAEAEADKIRKSNLPKAVKDRKVLEELEKASKQIDELNAHVFNTQPTNISRMVDSGSRGKRNQLKQIVSTPALVKDAKERTVPYLIPRSYSEGMDMASYWTTMHGARKGTIQKVQGVRDPGYLSKQIMNSTMNQLVTEEDCGTNQGVWLSSEDPDVMDRYLAKASRVGGTRYRHNTLITPKVLSEARKKDVKELYVRSPMRCEAEHGICKKCMGLAAGGKHYDIGDNVGVIAGQAIGEPSTQLALSEFHTGGVAESRGAKSAPTFDRLKELLRLHQSSADAATLATVSGKVTKIRPAGQGGEYVTIGTRDHYVPAHQATTVKLHQQVGKGDTLSNGLVDPKKLLPLKGIHAVQDYVAGEMQSVLKPTVDVRRRNIEVVVKSLTNTTHVDDPGSHPDWVTGDLRPLSVVQAWNRKARHPAKHTPILKGVDILPLEMQEDWMARLNFQRLNTTLLEAAREGWKTDIHGFHPVPAAAYAAEFGKGKEVHKEKWKGQY